MRELMPVCMKVEFQPTPPARTETKIQCDSAFLSDISTHSAREDGDFAGVVHAGLPAGISTHSAREDGDAC